MSPHPLLISIPSQTDVRARVWEKKTLIGEQRERKKERKKKQSSPTSKEREKIKDYKTEPFKQLSV